uniref:PTS system mannose/fructose/sorbose family transporter subunit IID n=1 Tax=Ndongobacter massiliensis TaxID=1871025 RepID=UPI000930F05E|nr:PTS system mannose/fructose/sorbose family transporter subunit IID [Ndongobacter massiliensis]
MVNQLAKVQELTSKDVTKAWAKYILCAEVSSGYERLTALAFSYGVSEALEKLYGHDEEEYRTALERHLMFYNSEAIWGSLIIGITLALEEERALKIASGSFEETEKKDLADVVTNFKLGLMGPLAGIGDTINHAMIRPLLLSAFIPLASSGLWIAGVAPIVIWGVGTSFLGYSLLQLGYNSGKNSVDHVLGAGKINTFINGAGILGLFMMGGLSAQYVKFQTAISWTNAVGETVELQQFIDKIFPNLFPLAIIIGIVFFFKKIGQKYVSLLMLILALSLVLSFFGLV